jgi:heme-degrading monooxygenase HmoA
MNHASYQINLPQNTDVVIFYNGIKALNWRGFVWLWQQIITAKLASITSIITAPGCIEAKVGICSPKEATIVSYWQDEASLRGFFSSPLHRQMMKDVMQIIELDHQAIAMFNETYRPLRSGRYFNEPQGLAKIYPALEQTKVVEKH